MNSADLITSFFNNELSPDQERQFLVSVASSDSMRLGLKSHVMLDRILIEENQQVEISPAVRRSILKEAAVVAAGVGGGASSEAFAATSGVSSTAAAGTSGGFFGNWLAIPATLLVALGSFFVGYSVADESEQQGSATVALTEPIDLFSSISMSQFARIAASPVAFIADRRDDKEVRPDRSNVSAVTTASLRTSRSSAVGTSDLSGEDDRTENVSSVSDTTRNGSGGSIQPSTVDHGTTILNKGRRSEKKE